jgi:hypothetical protein
MEYMIIEKWKNLISPYVITNEQGEVMLFDTEEDALVAMEELCQDGIVIPY